MGEIVKEKSSKRGNPNWKRGRSGNPNGRPKIGNSVAGYLRDFMAAKESKDKHTRMERLAQNLYISAMSDNPVPAARLILETLGMLNIESMLDEIKATLARVEAER